MAEDSKELAIGTKAVRAFIARVLSGSEEIAIDGALYRGYRVANVTNARSGKQVDYRYWKNSLRPVPVNDCVVILASVERPAQDSRHAVRFSTRDEIVWVR